MLFNKYQLDLWCSMIKSIERYRKGELSYYDFVGELEGAIDAGEFQYKELIEQWYDLWTPLEILRAQNGNDVSLKDSDRYLSEMETFLKNTIKED